MEHQIYVCGVGGQGVQLVAKTFVLAAMGEGRHVMLNGFYGHEMRGGISRSTVVIGDGPLKSLPVASQVGAALVLHADYWDQSAPRVAERALVVCDEDVAADLPPMPGRRVVRAPAARIARDLGNPMVMGMALLSAFCRTTGLARVQSLVEAMKSLVPEYRHQHIAGNEQALLRGADAVGALAHPLELLPAAGEAVA
jgi:2-oxoglutarate ferredoxin oxidoreductase subunit gamma